MTFSFQLKFELLENLKPKMETENLLRNPKISLKFCGKNETPPKADQDLLPISIHSCPDDFSTLDYYEVRKFTAGISFRNFRILGRSLS